MPSELKHLNDFIAAGISTRRKRYPRRQPGNLRGLSKGGGQSAEQRLVEAQFAAKISGNWPNAKSEYGAAAEEVFGSRRIVDLDLARRLSGVYNTPEQRLVNLMPTNGPAAQLTDEYFGDLLAEPARRGKNKVLYLMGVGVSGKTTVARKVLDEEGDRYHAIFTRVTSPISQVKSVIRRILKADKEVDMRLVLRRLEALVNARIVKALETGETEPLHQVALRNGDCLLAAEYMLNRYRQRPDSRVNIGVYTNFGAPGDIRLVTNDALKVLADIKSDIPNMASLTGNPLKDAIAFKTALVNHAYECLAAYDRDHPKGVAGHLPEGNLRKAVIGDQSVGLSLVDTDIYRNMTLGDLEKRLRKRAARPDQGLRKAGLVPRAE